MVKKIITFLYLMLTLTATSMAQTSANQNMQIKIITDTQTVFANLNNTPAAKDFFAMLPLTLTLVDYGQNEKVSDLPKPLSLDGSPSGYTPQRGDIAHYAPWGNFVIFRHNFSYSNGLIKLGDISENLDELDRSGTIQITIEALHE